MRADRKCIRPKCRAQAGQRGLCRAHYLQWRNNNPTADVAHVAAHINRLRAAGLTWRHMRQLSGVPDRTLQSIAFGDRAAYVWSTTAAKILAVTIPDLLHQSAADEARVPVIGTARRLQALAVNGYTSEEIAALIDYHSGSFARVLHGTKPNVTASTARRADEVFRRLQMVPAPDSWASRRARARALKNGWMPALAWDEDSIDDPAAKPYQPPKLRPGRGCSVPSDFLDIVADHRELGRSDADIAERLGITYDAFEMRIRRALKAAS